VSRSESEAVAGFEEGMAGGGGAPGAEEREGFEGHAARVLGELRGALAEIVEAVPERVRRAVELQRALGVDAPLAWRVFKVATSEDPMAASGYVPTRGQLLTLLEAAERGGVPDGVVERARRAVEGFEALCREHAGDRAMLDAMLASLRPGAESGIDERTRRTAFQQNARIWGVQAHTAVRAFILYPGRDGSVMGTAAVAGLVGLHAVRPEAPLVVHAVSRFEGGEGMRALPSEDRSGLLLEFSSPGLEYVTEPGDDRTLVTRVCAPGIGRRAAVTTFSLTTSEVPTERLNRVTLGHGTSTPVEACHLELLAPAGLTDARTARVAVYGRRTRVERAIELRSEDILPVRGEVTALGTMTAVPPLAGVPRWPEVVRHVLERVGAWGTRFDVYRCRVTYPVLHALVCMQVDRRAGDEGEE